MQTYAHCVLTYMVFRRREPLAVKVALFSVFPDLPYIIAFLASWGSVGPTNRETLQRGIVSVFGNATHSLTLCLVVGAIVLLARPNNVLPFVLAWLLHIVVDILTHVQDATPIFWPLSDRRFPGLISYWDPLYHGGIVSLLSKWCVMICLAYITVSKLREAYKSRHAVASVEMK